MKEIISTPDAPAAIGPYSQAVKSAGLVFVSGQLPVNPATGELAENDIFSQTKQSLLNLQSILEAGGSSLQNVVKITVYLSDINDFNGMNEAYRSFFDRDFPARSAFQVAALPKSAKVEIEAIASL
jgi:2-iminobutanoate/2-iminopropanoate deaminase